MIKVIKTVQRSISKLYDGQVDHVISRCGHTD